MRSAASALDAKAQTDNRPRAIENTFGHHRSPRESDVEISDGDDLGIPAPRPHSRPRTLSSSPDPIRLHPFQTHPGHLQHEDPWKGEGKDFSPKPQSIIAVTSDVEEIEDFTSEPANDCPVTSRPPRSQPAAKISTPCIRSIKRDSVAEECEGYEPSINLRKIHTLKGRAEGVMKKMEAKGSTKVYHHCVFRYNNSHLQLVYSLYAAARLHSYSIHTIHISIALSHRGVTFEAPFASMGGWFEDIYYRRRFRPPCLSV